MGLDSVELLMAIEEAFAISIPDKDAQFLTTPRRVVAYLEHSLATGTESLRGDQRAFHLLRRAGMAELGLPRSAFSPATPWGALLPVQERRRTWDRLRVATASLDWPAIPFWDTVSEGGATAGATARWLAIHAPAAIRRGEGWSRPEIERTVSAVVCEQLGIESFAWDDRFDEDLNWGY